jgi:F0F1-type ATP synthase membrane subunit b/b'
MTIDTEMKRLTQDIASSRSERVRRIEEIREEANDIKGDAQCLIMGFEAYRQETNRQLRRNLTRDKAGRKSETRDILKEAEYILKGFKAAREDSNARLRDDLSRATTVIRSEVRRLLGQAQKLIKGFGTSRQNLSSQLRKDLDGSRAKSESEVERLLGNAQRLVMNIRTSCKEAAIQLRGDLARSRADVESDVKQMQSDFRKARRDVRVALKEARVAWQDLAAGKMLSDAQLTEKNPDYIARLLAVVNEHPEGITLGDAADVLGVVPVVLARASKTLVDKGITRKEDRLYFPAASKRGEHG